MEENTILPQEESAAEVVDIQFRPGQKIYFFDPDGLACKAGDHVIIDTARGPEYGICVGGNHHISTKDVVSPLRPVLRIATAQDEQTMEQNRIKEKQAYEACLKKIEEHGLDMQLVSAEYAYDGSKILFFFTADERVDFRELVKALAGMFHTRIELRQIGVRDKAKMVGGLGICGRPFCCASFLDDFQPVSIKMAKTQNLSLNPTKISGTCGRLMCCLKYEQDAYEDLIRTSPKLDSFVDTPDGRGTVVEQDLLRQRVKVRMEDRPEVIGTFSNEEIAVLRSGKAKKTDPPIPADLAPISGKGKRRQEPEDSDSTFLDPIRFRYSTESIVEEQAPSVDQVPEDETAQQKNKRRRRKLKAPNQEQPIPQEDAPQEKKPEPKKKPVKKSDEKTSDEDKKPQESAEAIPVKKHRNNYHRRRRPKGNGEEKNAN